MDVIIIAVLGAAVYFQHYTLATVVGALYVALIGASVRAEVKLCSMVTSAVISDKIDGK